MGASSFSEAFIRRPVGTALLAIGLFLVGAVAYRFLTVASMPTVDFPTINVTASRPGADPETMAATVAAPLERRLGEIAGVTELTSRSSLGSTRITVQFDLARNIDGAARDVQAAINAALTDLPSDLPSSPAFRKSNPAATPIMILALTSKSLPPSVLYDAADSVIAQRLAQIEGVAEVTVNGAEQPAIRVRVDPIALASMGLGFEDVRTAVANTNAVGPIGAFNSSERAVTISANDQIRTAADYDPIVVRSANGTVVRLSSIASIELGVRDNRAAAWFNGQPSVLLVINKQANSNVIETVDRIYALLPELKRWIPAGVDISVLSDRTRTIRASVFDMQLTLIATVILVMLVVFVFLRRAATTIAAGVTVPLALTPMICAHFVREPPSADAAWLDRVVGRILGAMVRFYARSLAVVLGHRALMLLVMAATMAITAMLYVRTPKGFFPLDDTGLIYGGTQASTEVSFQTMYDLQQKAQAVVRDDPAVADVGSSIGTSGWNASVNRGNLFISLKPLAERGGLNSQAVANRLRQKTADIPGLRVFFFPMQDVRVGGRQSDSTYQFTLWDANYNELLLWAPRILAKIQTLPGLVDVSTDREQGGLQVNVAIDRVAASRLGVRVQDIANALNNSYAQRQISTLYTQRNQYRVILEIDPQYQRDPTDLTRIYVSGAGNTQVPLTAVTTIG